MNIGENLQDEALRKEEAKIRFKREQNRKRCERIHNSRARLIGVDVDALDAQVEEIRRNRQNYKDGDKLDQLRYQNIDRALEAAADEERVLRAQQMQQLKQSWTAARATKEQREYTDRTAPDYEREKLSASSCQLLDGEDGSRATRKVAQNQQMRRWIQEQIGEKAYVKEMEREEEMRYAETLKLIGEMRDAAEKEEADMRKAYLDRANRENEEVMRMTREIKRQEKEEWDRLTPAEKSKFSSLDLFDETAGKAMDVSGRVVRKDIFKGFTEAQRRRIFQENEAIIQQKRDRDQGNRQGNADWNMQQLAISRALDMAHLDEEQLRQAELERHLSVLAHQQAVARMKKDEEKRERYGGISAEFFNNFGKSAR